MNIKDHVLHFGVNLAKRYTTKQKQMFFSEVESYFSKLGYSLEQQASKNKFNPLTNLLIGKIQPAKRVVLCPYDTPARALLPYVYFPFNLSENRRQEYLELIISTLIYVLVSIFAYFVISQFADLTTWLQGIIIILFAILLLGCYKLLVGIPNPVNFNRNSVSLALIAALAEQTKNNSQVCYILLDKNASSNAGLKILSGDERFKNKTFIYIDCIAYGESLVCAHTPAADLEADKLNDFLANVNVMSQVFKGDRLQDTSLHFFPKMLHLCVGTIEDRKMRVINTRTKKDYQIDVPRLEMLRDGLLKYLEN